MQSKNQFQKKLLRPKKLATLVLILGLCSSIMFGFLALKSNLETLLPAQAGQSQLQESIDKEQILLLVNQERFNFNLKPLKSNPKLTQAANDKISDMITNNYFAHISPSGKKWSEFIQAVDYNYTIGGENLARNYTTPKETVQAWLNSPTHRENILNPKLKETGIALKSSIKNQTKNIYIVQTFGSLE